MPNSEWTPTSQGPEQSGVLLSTIPRIRKALTCYQPRCAPRTACLAVRDEARKMPGCGQILAAELGEKNAPDIC